MRSPFFLLLLGALFLPAATHAAVADSGDLIKASTPAVYYLGADQKRYVFPTEQVFHSWYADFSSVRAIADTELASFPLGGNVTYRPGSRLVKITTDPKVYAVDLGGVLRWVQTESIARAVFGDNWSQLIDDVPDIVFINYRVGIPISSGADYDPVLARASSTSILVDKSLASPSSTIPTIPLSPTSTTSVPIPSNTLSLSVPTLRPIAGQTISVLAAAQPSASIANIRILLNGTLQRECAYSPCGADVLIAANLANTSQTLRAEASWIDGARLIATGTLDIQPALGVSLTITHPEIRRNGLQEIIVQVDQSFVSYLIDLYVDNVNVRGCNSTQQCRYTFTESSATGTIHSVYAIAQNRNGNPRRSETQTYLVVDNDHPIPTVTFGKTSILRGENVDVTVHATDDDGITSTELWFDGSRVKQCHSATCTATIGPWSVPRSVAVVGKSMDSLGLSGFATSSALFVQ